MTWIATLLAVIIGAGVASFTQILLFIHAARKERIFKVREALGDFGAAAYAYLDAQENLAAFGQRQMNTPLPHTVVPIDVQPPEELAKEYARHDTFFDARERAAGAAYWSQREKLLAGKAKLFVLIVDKAFQQRTTEMCQRLIDMKPSQDSPESSDGRTNPQFALVRQLRSNVDQWLADATTHASGVFM